MPNLPFVLSLAEDLNRLSMAPFYSGASPYYAHYPYLPITQKHPLCAHDKKNKQVLQIKNKGGFQVCLDVTQFKPSELTVKVVDKCVVVEGKHEEREDDHGYIARQFTRRYTLPKDCKEESVVSTLSSDGVLTINVAKPSIDDKPNERIVQIQQVGPAHLNINLNAEDADKADKTDKADQAEKVAEK